MSVNGTRSKPRAVYRNLPHRDRGLRESGCDPDLETFSEGYVYGFRYEFLVGPYRIQPEPQFHGGCGEERREFQRCGGKRRHDAETDLM